MSQTVVSLLFLAYLSGTWSSGTAGRIAAAHGRRVVLASSGTVMLAGLLATLVPSIPVIVVGLLLFTAGFFAAHAVASGWTPVAADPQARAQASSLYYLGYYGGSSLFGWLLGLVFVSAGWVVFSSLVLGMCVLAFGVAFLLPVVMVGLNFAGVVSARSWWEGWRWSVLIAFLFAAVATPTADVVSMFALAIPICGLYFLAVGICALRDRRRDRAALEDDPPDEAWAEAVT